MTRVSGSITLHFDDTSSVERHLLALTGASLALETDGEAAANIADRSWMNERPLLTAWSVDVAFNLVATDGIPDITQSELEALAFARTTFDIHLTAANGTVYVGQGFVASYQLGSADQKAGTATARIRGSGVLTPTWPDYGCPSGVINISSEDPVSKRHYLGSEAGWVRIQYTSSVVNTTWSVDYNGAVVLSWVGLGAGSEYFYYDPEDEGPYYIDVTMTPDIISHSWSYNVFCPGAYSP